MGRTPMNSSKLNRSRPSPLMSPLRNRERQALDTDNEARYVVTVRSAKNLKRQGFRGLTNPYCKLNVGRQGPFTTDVVYDSTNPSWEHKRQTFEFRKGKRPEDDKLSLTCFNAGDVPELIGRLNVALSPANHKVISLPMFRKELGGSQVWVGSVELELHYIPEIESGAAGTGTDGEDVSEGSASPGLTSPAASARPFRRATVPFPRVADDAMVSPGGTVQADLLAMSPRMKKRAESALTARKSDSDRGRHSFTGAEESFADHGGGEALGETEHPEAGFSGGGGGGWKMFLAGFICSTALVLGALFAAYGDPLFLSTSGFGMRVEKDGRQAFIVIDGSKVSWLLDRHVVVLVGEKELCRGGKPAPSPEMESFAWAYGFSSSETSDFDHEAIGEVTAPEAYDFDAADASGDSGEGDAEGSREERATPEGATRHGTVPPCGAMCTLTSWLTTPLEVDKRNVH